ncbi:MAG: hypothetical protein H7099_07660, partial [Gemmatimonadaceae bacterium]|nr:hypothetical protein [Gemmatimonadaceae bacterium]
MTRRALMLRHRLRSVCVRDLIFPVVVTLLVIITMFFPQSPLRDAVTHGDVTGMRIAISREFAIVAPFCAILDMQSLLTVPQHIAVLVTLLIGFAIWRCVVFARSTSYPVWRREAGGLLLTVIAVPVLMLLVNVLSPRPMARL